MGRTLVTATQIILDEQREFGDFYRALRRADQQAFEELFSHARKHTAPISMASHALPFEAVLLAMLLEECKKSNQLSQQLDELGKVVDKLHQLVDEFTSSA